MSASRPDAADLRGIADDIFLKQWTSQAATPPFALLRSQIDARDSRHRATAASRARNRSARRCRTPCTGWKVTVLTCVAARASSVSPISEATEVVFTICTMKPTVGGSISRTACGRITSRSVRRKRKPSAVAASHWPLGIASMEPRKISPKKARAVEAEGQRRRGPRIRAVAEEGRAVIDHEELDQDRRAHEELDVAGRQPAQRPRRRDPERRDDHAEQRRRRRRR